MLTRVRTFGTVFGPPLGRLFLGLVGVVSTGVWRGGGGWDREAQPPGSELMHTSMLADGDGREVIMASPW